MRVGCGVQEEELAITQPVGQVVCMEALGVIGAELIMAAAVGGRAVVVAGEHRRAGYERTGPRVSAHRGTHHHEGDVIGIAYAELGVAAEEDRTQVERRAGLVARNVLPVGADAHLAHLDEHLFRRICHVEVCRAACHAAGVLVRTEHAHPAIGSAIGLETLEAFRGIMQDPGETVHRNPEVVRDFRLAPGTVLISGHHYRAGGIECE